MIFLGFWGPKRPKSKLKICLRRLFRLSSGYHSVNAYQQIPVISLQLEILTFGDLLWSRVKQSEEYTPVMILDLTVFKRQFPFFATTPRSRDGGGDERPPSAGGIQIPITAQANRRIVLWDLILI